jgi:hypothetical protein
MPCFQTSPTYPLPIAITHAYSILALHRTIQLTNELIE